MRTIIMLLLFTTSVTVSAQNIKLPAPVKSGGKSVMEALWNRHSTRSFQNKELSKETLSNLLWAANGINRKDGKRTNPTGMNRQEINIFVFMKDAVYRHDYKTHTLVKIKSGDYRNMIAHGQNYVNEAPISLVIVANVETTSNTKNLTDKMPLLYADAGIVSENINLYCAGNGLGTVTRANMDNEAIKKLLGLGDKYLPILNNPVGFVK